MVALMLPVGTLADGESDFTLYYDGVNFGKTKNLTTAYAEILAGNLQFRHIHLNCLALLVFVD